MRRPMVFIASAFGGGIWAAFLADIDLKYWVFMLMNTAVISMWFLSQKKKQKLFLACCLFLCVFSTGASWMELSLQHNDPFVEQAGRRIRVSGLVTDVEERDEAYRLTVITKESKLLVNYYKSLKHAQDLSGSYITITGQVALPQPRRNPGCFDYRLYLRACGIQVFITADTLERLEVKPNRYVKMVSGIRNHFANKLRQYVSKDVQGIVMAMLFGDKSALDETIYENFQRNGTAHILAVSGLHVGILYAFLQFLWKGKKGFLFNIVILGALLLYTALADFSPSVVRAAVMITLHLGAKALHQRYDLLSAAAFTFLLMLWINPVQLFHVGFQLSFLAVASLGVILPFVERLYQGIFLSTLAIQAGMLPYTAYVFNYVSLGAFFVNIPIIALAGILLPVGISLVAVSFLSDTVFGIGVTVLEQGCKVLLFLNNIVYAGGRTSFDVVSPQVFFLGLYYGLLFFTVCEKGRILMIRKKWKAFTACVLLLTVLAGVLAMGTDRGFSKSSIVFVDVGQGDCIHVRTKEGKNFLFDGGGSIRYDVGKKILKPYLLKNGVKKVDAAFVTHLHQDHFGGIRSLAQEGMIEKIGVYEGNQVIEKKIRQETKTKLLYLYKGQRVKLGKAIFLDILYPEKKSQNEYKQIIENQEDENASSLIMRLTYEDFSILITGDIDQQGECRLTELYQHKELESDILKVAHHGSKYSSSELFLDVVRPKLAVFQVGKNNFGHPSQAVIEKCRQRGIMIYRNDTSGAIMLDQRKGDRGISIQKMIE